MYLSSKIFISIALSLLSFSIIHCDPTTYDQRQTGKYNFHVNLKDVKIFAISGDGVGGDIGDYDYNYDYDHLTVKPIKPVYGSIEPEKPTKPVYGSIEPEKPTKPATNPSTSSEAINKPSSNVTNAHPYEFVDKIPVEVIMDPINKTETPKPVVPGPSIPRKHSVEILSDVEDDKIVNESAENVTNNKTPNRQGNRTRKCLPNQRDSNGRCRRTGDNGLLTLRKLVSLVNMFKEEEKEDRK